jgi:putative membrane protein
MWLGDLFGFERNMYDRVAHFTVGFYAFALAELVGHETGGAFAGTVLYLFPLVYYSDGRDGLRT